MIVAAVAGVAVIGGLVSLWFGVWGGGSSSHEPRSRHSAPTLFYSADAQHTGAAPLDGATVSDRIWAFTERTSGISEVHFSIDGDLVNIERRIPYELGRPPGFDTRSLDDGEHTLTAELHLDGGGTETLTVNFVVDNPGSARIPDARRTARDGATASEGVVVGGGSPVLTFDLDAADLGRQTERDLERIVQGEESIRHGGIGTEDTFVCDGRMGDVCPDYDGSQGRVLGLRHPARQHYAGTWNGLIRFPAMREGWLTFKVRYGPSWDNSRTRGKLWGLGGVSAQGSDLGPLRPPMHGAHANPGDGWSTRRVVKDDGQIIDYLYDPAKDRPPYDDNKFGDRAWWGAEGSTDGSNDHIDGWNRGQKLVKNGEWMEFAQHIDVDKGLIESYLNGELMSSVTNRPLTEAGAPINALLAHAYIGSEDSGNNTQNSEVWTYITDISVTKVR